MPEPTEISYEDAVSRIEDIVESLERGEADLAEALARYEAGMKLLAQCYGLLDRADRVVSVLTGVDDEGNATTAPFDATATIERAADSASGTPKGKPPADVPKTGDRAPRSPRARRPARPLDDPDDDGCEPPF